MHEYPKLTWRDALTLVTGYVLLDWASYIRPLHELNITPWNPAPALGLIYLLRFGNPAMAPLALAIFLADAWVRSLPVSLGVSIVLALVLAVGYRLIAEVLRARLASRAVFDDLRGLFSWAAIVTVGTLINSAIYVGVLRFGQLIPVSSVRDAFVRYWVGDCVGAIVSMPLLWMLLDRRGRGRLRLALINGDAAGSVVLTALALWVAFASGSSADFKYFYVLSLPIVWAAVRHGLPGAVFGATLIQLAILGLVQWLGVATVTVLEVQILAAVLALIGFLIGVVVDEKQRVSAELRQSLRLAAAGEMAGALAHELNQPLTALSTYGTACRLLLDAGETGARLRDAIEHMIDESLRAAEVVRRLRDFFRTGATRLEALSTAELLAAASAPFAAKAAQSGVELVVDNSSSFALYADRLQLEVVLRNLLSNAFESVAQRPPGARRVCIAVRQEGAGRAAICVEDSGPGVSEATAARLFEAFASSKTSGLGLGLLISRAIVEAHGGQLWAEVAEHGIFRLVLPTEGNTHHAG
jgi:signal transduction histidine kinase